MRTMCFTKALLCLAMFGYPLAWHKASAGSSLVWIGAEIQVCRTHVGVRIPEAKVKSLAAEAKLMLSKDVVSTRSMRSFCGQVSFFAGLVPHLRPFLSGCWAAIASATAKKPKSSTNDGKSHHLSGKRTAANSIVFVRQARHSLSWIRAFMMGSPSGVTRRFPVCTSRVRESGSFIATDASPWGIGGILVRQGEVVEYFYDHIHLEDCKRFNAEIGSSAFNTLWEALALLVAIRLWLPTLSWIDLTVKSDNLAALYAALKYKANDPKLNAIAREIAYDVCQGEYELKLLKHIPGISNIIPDVLSRVHSPSPPPWPTELGHATQRWLPARGSGFWRTWQTAK